MTTKQKVLIVDDEPRNQRIAIEAIEDVADYKVASNGEEALAAMEEFIPDLVLLDIMMPGIDGYAVCAQIRKKPEFCFVKVILVSGKAMIEEKIHGYEVGADDYITKPFLHEELLAKTKVFLRLSKFEREMSELNVLLEKKVQEKTKALYDAQALLMNTAKMSALGEMAGGVAHEINNPLATIGLLAHQTKKMILADPLKWQEKIVKQSETILESTKHIASIVHGLRTFSRDGSQDSFESIPLRQIITSTLNLCQAKFVHDRVPLEIVDFDDSIHIYCRPIQIAQVLMNLLSNACDAVSPLKERWIKLSVQQKGKNTEMSIMDSGTGISETFREKIFQPLFTTKEVGKGTGLGLSISRGIVEGHSGSLTLNLNNPHTEFLLSLPSEGPEILSEKSKSEKELVEA